LNGVKLTPKVIGGLNAGARKKRRRRGGGGGRRLTQTVGAVDGEAHEDDVRVGVGQRPQAVVVLLARRVPQSQLHLQGRREIMTSGREGGRFIRPPFCLNLLPRARGQAFSRPLGERFIHDNLYILYLL